MHLTSDAQSSIEAAEILKVRHMAKIGISCEQRECEW
jgi:hypothetical protein